jgi:hypothetical protein
MSVDKRLGCIELPVNTYWVRRPARLKLELVWLVVEDVMVGGIRELFSNDGNKVSVIEVGDNIFLSGTSII